MASEKKTIRSGIRANEPTANDHVYTDEALDSMVAQIQEKAKGRRMTGRLGQTGGRVNMTAASHLVLGARRSGDGGMEVDIEVLDTPLGRQLSEMLAAGLRVAAFPSVMGTVGDGGLIEVYELSTVDLFPASCAICGGPHMHYQHFKPGEANDAAD